MPAVLQEKRAMARKSHGRSLPARLTEEAMRLARIASGYTGESVTEYVSRVVIEHARGDIDRLHAELEGGPAKAKPKR